MRNSNSFVAKKPSKSVISNSDVLDKPSKPPENNPKKKMFREAKSALKEPRLPSSIILPESARIISGSLDDASLLAEIRKRICNHNARTIRVSPVPKTCPSLLLQNLCPTSVAVRIPSGRNRRYAFIEFKTPAEAETAAKEVTGRVMNGKSIRAIVCSQKPTRTEADWQSPMERGLDAFDLTTLYVSCLPRSTERTILAQIFRTAHKIKYETLPDGTSKGFCILKYQTRELAQKAFMERHDTLLSGIPIYVNFLIKSKAKLDGNEVMRREGVLHKELKRKAPEEDEVVVMPAKKRCCESMDPEKVGVVGDSTVQARKITTKNKAGRGVHVTLPSNLNDRDPSFSIKYSMDPKSKKPKLQPYQLSKKSGNRIKKPRRPK